MKLFSVRSATRAAGLAALWTLTACARAKQTTDLSGVKQLLAARGTWQLPVTGDSAAGSWARGVVRGEVPVDTAIKVALLRNRELHASLEAVGVVQADFAQARLVANPTLSAERLVAGGGTGALQLAGVVLPLVDALQRPLRTRIAESATRAAEQRVADAVIDLAARVRVAYVTTQAATQMVELWETVAAATAASATTARVLHDAGNVPDLALAQEQAMAAQARVSLIRAQEERLVARAELSRLMGMDATDTTWSVAQRMPDPESAEPSGAEVVEMARLRRLDLRARRQDVETHARTLGLTQRFALLADGTIGLSYEKEPDGAFRGGGFSLPIPVFDRGQAKVARNRAMLRQAVALHDAAVVAASAEVATLAARAAGARARARQLWSDVLPQRRTIVSETQRFVNAMQETIFSLLLARQAEIEAGQAYVEALREYWTARAQLERAAGGSLASVTDAERRFGNEPPTTGSKP